jgi:hypothetical protein
LEAVSQKNTIIYCTHSQFLLNPAIIKLGSIKIVEKEKASINLQEYGSYKGNKDKGALSPVYQALNLNFSNDFIGKIAITEGITDFYFFELLKKYTSQVNKDLKIIPGSGAGNSSTLLSLAISFADNFVMFFDSDEAGHKEYKKYIKEFGEELKGRFYFYHDDKPKFLLEDHLSDTDKSKLLMITNTKDLKKAFAMLFYDCKDEAKNFIKNLDNESLSLISKTAKVLNESINI